MRYTSDTKLVNALFCLGNWNSPRNFALTTRWPFPLRPSKSLTSNCNDMVHESIGVMIVLPQVIPLNRLRECSTCGTNQRPTNPDAGTHIRTWSCKSWRWLADWTHDLQWCGEVTQHAATQPPAQAPMHTHTHTRMHNKMWCKRIVIYDLE